MEKELLNLKELVNQKGALIKAINHYMIDNGVTGNHVANRLGISQPQLSNYMTFKNAFTMRFMDTFKDMFQENEEVIFEAIMEHRILCDIKKEYIKGGTI